MGDVLASLHLLGDCEDHGFLTPFLDPSLLPICWQGLGRVDSPIKTSLLHLLLLSK